MTSPEPSRRSADLILALAAGVAAYTVLRNPAMRQTLWRALVRTVTITLPGFLVHQVREAWAASSGQLSVRE